MAHSPQICTFEKIRNDLTEKHALYRTTEHANLYVFSSDMFLRLLYVVESTDKIVNWNKYYAYYVRMS